MTNSFLRLTPSRDSKGKLVLVDGLIAFRLGLWANGEEIDSLHVNSGAPGIQTEADLKLFGASNSRPGSMEPIPEGYYDVGPPEYATPNSLSGSWGAGLGPVWFDLPSRQPGQRSAFGMHLDSNRANSPGSAGCIVTRSLKDLQTLIAWYSKHKPKLLVVDYKLGSVSNPASLKPETTTPPVPGPASFKLDVNQNGMTLVVLEKLMPGLYSVFSDSPSWTGKLVKKD